MSEHYVNVAYQIPEARRADFVAALERTNTRFETEAEAVAAYSFLGPDAQSLLAPGGAGKPDWADRDMPVRAQLRPCAIREKGGKVTVTYMCGDKETQQRFGRFLLKLYRAAGFADVSAKGINEHDA